MLSRFIVFGLFAGFVSLSQASVGVLDENEFEGRIEYLIKNVGDEWSYTLWYKGTRWRSELRQGKLLYELKIGDGEFKSGFLVNEGGKEYRSLARGLGPPEGGGGGQRMPSKDGRKKGNRVELEKLDDWIQEGNDSFEIDGFSSRLLLFKGPGKNFEIYLSDGLPAYSPLAIPSFKVTEEKKPLFAAFFRLHAEMPLKVEETGKSKKSFSMVVTKIVREPVDEALVSIPEDYTLKGSRMGGPPPGGGGGKRSGSPHGRGGGRPPR